MLVNNEIWFLTRSFDMLNGPNEWDDETLRIGLEKGDELKVVLENGYYATVLVKSGKQYFVELN